MQLLYFCLLLFLFCISDPSTLTFSVTEASECESVKSDEGQRKMMELKKKDHSLPKCCLRYNIQSITNN